MNLSRSISKLFSYNVQPAALNNIHKSLIHLSSTSFLIHEKRTGPRKWENYNKKIFPPQTENEEPRPAVYFVLMIFVF